jgi:WD40 repeat protein
MGEVYRARDTKLNRDVAIKVLSPAFAEDPARMQRFEREAQLLASLNHPNIAAIYGIEQGAIVMELVEGAEVAGPLPPDTVLNDARQIAAGLEAAHERGIVHRDLKPANIKVTPDGTIKLLDFGLAKTTESAAVSNSTQSPTLSLAMTQVGMIMGTAGYMSPEQARGKPVDKRADIWAFGVILYELISGKKLFAGHETVTDIIAAVVTHEPDLGAIPEDLRPVIKACLEKDPRNRLRDIGDWQRLRDLGPRPVLDHTKTAAKRSPGQLAGWIAAAVFAIALAGVLIAPRREATPALRPLLRFEVEESALGPVAISPDGSRVAYTQNGGPAMVRRLDETQAHRIPGTDGALVVAFSPDGQWIALGNGPSLRKVPLSGGPPLVIPEAAAGVGIAWGDDGYIAFTPSVRAPIFRVPASGGKAAPATALDSSRGEVTHRSPFALPGGKILLFNAAAHGGNYDDADIVAQNLETGRRIVLYHGGFSPRYTTGPSGQGYVLFARGNTIFALPFDAGKMQVREPAIPVLDGVATQRGGGLASFAVSSAGVAVYRPGVNSDLSTIGWLNASGHIQPLPLPAGIYSQVSVSSDGKHILYRVGADDGVDLWIYDTETGNRSRLTSSKQATEALWAPDGRHVLYADADGSVHWVRSDGSSQPRVLRLNVHPSSFTPDGRGVLALVATPTQGVALIPFPDPASDDPHLGAPQILFPHSGIPSGAAAALSPDGRWLVYGSNESGRQEIYVRPFPSLDRKWQVSQDGGMFPKWSPRGELFFAALNQTIMAVAYSIQQNEFRHSAPRTWYASRLRTASGGGSFSVAPDGSRLIAQFPPENQGEPKHPTLVFLVNFPDEIERKVKAATK